MSEGYEVPLSYRGDRLYINGFNLTACFELNLFLFFSRICLVGEKPDKELPGIVEERGDTV